MRRFALLVALCCTAASAIASEVGLINHIAGDVEYVRGSSAAKVKAFMIVRAGEPPALWRHESRGGGDGAPPAGEP